MITQEKTNSINKIARVAGFLYLLVAIFGAFSILYVPSTLIVPGDAATTANSIINHALLMVVFALVGIPIAMLNLLNQSVVLLLLSGADYLTVFTADQLQAQAMLFLDLQEHGVFIASIFWGLWLLPLGYPNVREYDRSWAEWGNLEGTPIEP